LSQPRFLADENVPLEAVRGLQADGYDVVPVLSVCPGAPDEEVLALGTAQQRVVITLGPARTGEGHFPYFRLMSRRGIASSEVPGRSSGDNE